MPTSDAVVLDLVGIFSKLMIVVTLGFQGCGRISNAK